MNLNASEIPGRNESQPVKTRNAHQTAAALSQRRADAVLQYLLSQGVPVPQLTGHVGLGSDRPLGTNAPTDATNDRVDFIRARQGGAP